MERLDEYNVTLSGPSAASAGSLPLGNGDTGLNVWVEPNGDLLFYISKSDAWDGNACLLKVGRVRVSLAPNPFRDPADLRWELHLRDATVSVTNGAATLRIWVNAHRPVVHVEVDSPAPIALTVSLEVWRDALRRLRDDEEDMAYGMLNGPRRPMLLPDVVVASPADDIIWYHRNEASIWHDNMTLQGLAGLVRLQGDPLWQRTFGGLIRGPGLRKLADRVLQSDQPARQHLVSVFLLTDQTKTPEDWTAQVREGAAEAATADLAAERRRHCQWWTDFWQRSWIRVSGDDDAETVTRGYLLQRFMLACAGRGAYPIKFNGSLFTADWEFTGEPSSREACNADYRRWGGPYWFQNTRLAYWPMLAAGDYDLMKPLFSMYRDALPLALLRTQLYFGHGGAFFPETMEFWGAYANSNYGWQRPTNDISHVNNTYIRWYWQGGLELSLMMLDYYRHTQDEAFLTDTLLPIAAAVIAFYDEHHPRDGQGRLRLTPAMALETWQEAVNPAPDIAGLRAVLGELLNLPEDFTTEAQRTHWARLREAVPPLPRLTTDAGETLAAAAEIMTERRNSENPELYAVFPYRLFGVGRADLELARRTFAARAVKRNVCWYQDDIQAACLGLADEARRMLAERLGTKYEKARFPAFWGPHNDWIPDQDHGGVGMMALQAMLLQTDGRRLLLLPAWPVGWDAAFKLHAPQATVLSGEVRRGKLISLAVDPPERRRDVEIITHG